MKHNPLSSQKGKPLSGKTVFVEDPDEGGRIALSIDRDGDLELSGRDERVMWVRPAELVAALRDLGVLPPLPQVVWGDPAPRVTPSDRVRESWRRAAAADMNERPAFEEHESQRKVKNRAAEYRRQAAERRAKFYRDRDGDVWRSLGNGQLIIHKYADERAPIPHPDATSYDNVARQWGPLVAVTDPAISDPYAALRRAADDAAARAAQTAARLVPQSGAFADSMDSAFIRQLRRTAQRDIAAPSIWRNFQ